MRLDQFLSARTMFSRKELRQRILTGMVSVDGVLVRKPDTAVKPETQTVCMNGQVVPGDTWIYVLLHKPKGYVSSADEPGQHSVLELVPPELCRKALRPAGRLDKDSTGMILLTDDGQTTHQLISARSHTPKLYRIVLARPWEEAYAAQLAAGLTLSDGTQCLPAKAALIPGTDREVLIRLYEGKYHQVRRMFAALGNHVAELERVAVGGLAMPSDLALGECRLLTYKDIQKMLGNETDFLAMLQICQKNSS